MGYPVHIAWNGSLVVSAPSAVPNVPRTEAAFPRCTAIDMRWRRNSVERRSPDASSSLLPTSDMRRHRSIKLFADDLKFKLYSEISSCAKANKFQDYLLRLF